jgi:hypothetical protein
MTKSPETPPVSGIGASVPGLVVGTVVETGALVAFGAALHALTTSIISIKKDALALLIVNVLLERLRGLGQLPTIRNRIVFIR